MKKAADELIHLANDLCLNDTITVEIMKKEFLQATEAMLDKDISDNMAIGMHGANSILANVNGDGPVRVITHCNTGSLATAG